ncbi:MAG: outer membrane protein assembly factor BamE [Pseudomonadota bacterium]
MNQAFEYLACLPRRASVALFIIAMSVTISGCVVYKVDIQQGNEITQDMLNEVELGMTKREITQVLGYPLVTDPFHADRWDYFYSYKSGKSGETEKNGLTLLFEGDTLVEIKQQG